MDLPSTLAAVDRGIDLHGVCLYPIVNFPGWDDDRPCQNGLWGEPDDDGHRAIHEPMADALARQQERFEPTRLLPVG